MALLVTPLDALPGVCLDIQAWLKNKGTSTSIN